MVSQINFLLASTAIVQRKSTLFIFISTETLFQSLTIKIHKNNNISQKEIVFKALCHRANST